MKGSMCWLFDSICYCAIPQLQVKQPEHLLGQLVCSHSGNVLLLGSLKKGSYSPGLLFSALGRQSFITRYSQPLPGPGWNSKATELHAWQSRRWQPHTSHRHRRFRAGGSDCICCWNKTLNRRGEGIFEPPSRFCQAVPAVHTKHALARSGRGWRILSELLPSYNQLFPLIRLKPCDYQQSAKPSLLEPFWYFPLEIRTRTQAEC